MSKIIKKQGIKLNASYSTITKHYQCSRVKELKVIIYFFTTFNYPFGKFKLENKLERLIMLSVKLNVNKGRSGGGKRRTFDDNVNFQIVKNSLINRKKRIFLYFAFPNSVVDLNKRN